MASRILFSRLSLRAAATASRSRRFPSSSTSSSHARAFAVAAALTMTTTSTALAFSDSKSEIAAAPGVPSSTSSTPSASNSESVLSKEEISAVAAAIQDLLDNDEDDGLGPTIVRLAWHASGTYDKTSGTGGSEGATMRYSPECDHKANAGLAVAREALEPIKRLFPNISYADLWTLAGAVAIEHMGGPKILWRQGRRDYTPETGPSPPDGRLPAPDKGKVGATVQHIRQVFQRQGFNDRETVALIGAHALGRCHTDRSGYEGPWTRAPTTFSNMYFKELVDNTWTLKSWNGPDQFEDQSGDLMMLPADMALLWDKEFRTYVVEFAQDEDKFFDAFAVAFQKLEENGVKAFDGSASASGKPWYQFW